MRRCLVIATALAATLAAPAEAQEDAVPDAAGMDTLAAEVTPQSWYPDGYYDVRIAAESQVAETPRSPENYIVPCPVGGGNCFDPVDPRPQRVNPGESDPAVSRYGDIALAISRLRQELAQAGYPASIYAEPLAAYERRLVEAAADQGAADVEVEAARTLTAAIEKIRQRKAAKLPRVIAYDASPAVTQWVVTRSVGPSARTYPLHKALAKGDQLILRPGDRLELLNAGKTRKIYGPGKYRVGEMPPDAGEAPPRPRIAMGAVRGDPRTGAVFLTSPPNAEIWLVSAFAFSVCQRKNADPWERLGCRWNEIQSGTEKPLSGRFVYQVRWPDGTVRKGTREIAPFDDVLFKKVGS